MEELTVVEQLPEGAEIAYDVFLYNIPGFLKVNNSLPHLHFYLMDRSSDSVLAHMAFSREESEVLSPFKAPFGGMEMTADLDSTVVLFFVREVLRRLEENTVRFVRIKLAPDFYLPQPAVLTEALLNLGFTAKEELNYHAIPVSAQPLSDKMVHMEQRKLKKARKEKLTFHFADRSEFATVFRFIQHQRDTKGQYLSLDWEDLKVMVRNFPDQYHFVVVKMESQVIAASVLVRVSGQVIYNFFPAHDPGFNHLSPMVFLIDSVYNWSVKQGIKFIDLGTSYIGSAVNQSLVDFKEHMGGVLYISRSFRKAVSS